MTIFEYTIDSKELSRACSEPDPFTFDECFESCDDYDGSNWDLSLAEIDFDDNLDATIFTYTASNWNGGVCQRYNMNMDQSGIEGIYILNNGCCNNSEPIHFTKAITPQMNFEFLSIGWYWKTMITPGLQNAFGFMIYGDVPLTTGHYCARTRYFCICKEIVVPDLCKTDQTKEWRKKEH